jgi:hypothetical protein
MAIPASYHRRPTVLEVFAAFTIDPTRPPKRLARFDACVESVKTELPDGDVIFKLLPV